MRALRSRGRSVVRRGWRTPAVAMVLLAVVGVFLMLRPAHEPTRVAPPAEPLVMSLADLVKEGDQLWQPGASAPFTGLAVEYYPDGSFRSRSAVSNGLLHGLSQGWYTNGQLQVTEHFREGVSHGVRTKWYPNGNKQSETTIADGQIDGPFRRWHESGSISEQVEFVNGEPEGVSLAFFPSGFLKTRVRMEHGAVRERQSWEDGEFKP